MPHLRPMRRPDAHRPPRASVGLASQGALWFSECLSCGILSMLIELNLNEFRGRKWNYNNFPLRLRDPHRPAPSREAAVPRVCCPPLANRLLSFLSDPLTAILLQLSPREAILPSPRAHPGLAPHRPREAPPPSSSTRFPDHVPLTASSDRIFTPNFI